MAGLKRIAKMYGGMVVQGVRYVYDYATDECVPESEIPVGGERWKASEKKKWQDIAVSLGTEIPQDETGVV